MSEPTEAPCPHCPDGHQDPNRRPWGVYIPEARDGDGQPIRVHVERSDGAHVAESDAQWVRDLLNGRACRQHEALNRHHRKAAYSENDVVEEVGDTWRRWTVLAVGGESYFIRAIHDPGSEPRECCWAFEGMEGATVLVEGADRA